MNTKPIVVASLAMVLLTGCGAAKERIAAQDAERRSTAYEMLSAIQEAGEITCNGKEQCNRLFRVASDFIAEESSMKIQTVSENYISTYNPIKIGQIGMSARKTLTKDDNETIKLSISCKDEYRIAEIDCNRLVAALYKKYKRAIDSMR